MEETIKIGSEYMGQLVFQGEVILDYRPCPLNTKGHAILYRTDLEGGSIWRVEDVYILDYKSPSGHRNLHLMKFPHQILDRLLYYGCTYTKEFMDKLEAVQQERANKAREELLQSFKSLPKMGDTK